MHISIGREKAS